MDRRALVLNEGLAAEFPDDPEHQEKLASGLDNLARSLSIQGRNREAEELHRRSLAIREGLADRYPEMLGYGASYVTA